MFCVKCGTELPEEAVFCYKCGFKMASLIQNGNNSDTDDSAHESTSKDNSNNSDNQIRSDVYDASSVYEDEKAGEFEDLGEAFDTNAVNDVIAIKEDDNEEDNESNDVTERLVNFTNDLSLMTMMTEKGSIGVCDYKNNSLYMMSADDFVDKSNAILNSYARGTGLSGRDIILIFDPTLMGSASDGFIITNKYIIGSANKRLLPLKQIECLSYEDKNLKIKVFAEPAHILLVNITSGSAYIDIIKKLNKNLFDSDGTIRQTSCVLPAASNQKSDYEMEQRYLMLRNSLDSKFWDRFKGDVSVLDLVDSTKASNVVSSYAAGTGIREADIRVLIDGTVFGSAKKGLIMTNKYIIGSEGKRLIPLNQIKYLSVVKDESEVYTYNIFAEPSQQHITSLTDHIQYKDFIDKVNEVVFKDSKVISNVNDVLSESELRCPICKNLISYKDAYCDSCGTRLDWGGEANTSSEQKFVCPTCGQLISYKDAFCDNCGTQLTWD